MYVNFITLKKKHWDFNHLIVKLELYFEKKKKQLWFSKLLFFNYNLSLFYNQIWSNRKHDSSLPGRFHIIRSHCKQSRVYYRSRNTWRNRLPKRTSCKSHLITSAVSNCISSLGFSKSFVILFSLILIRKIISINIKYLIVLM